MLLVIKKALIDSNCPLSILQDFIEKSNENFWPIGLSNVFQREKNLSRLGMYKCRKLKGENVVTIVSSDNLFMPKELIDSKDGFTVFLGKDAFN